MSRPLTLGDLAEVVSASQDLLRVSGADIHYLVQSGCTEQALETIRAKIVNPYGHEAARFIARILAVAAVISRVPVTPVDTRQ